MNLSCSFCDEDIDPGGWCENGVDEMAFMWTHLTNDHQDNPEAQTKLAELNREWEEMMEEV